MDSTFEREPDVVGAVARTARRDFKQDDLSLIRVLIREVDLEGIAIVGTPFVIRRNAIWRVREPLERGLFGVGTGQPAASNARPAEFSVLCLRILQASLVYVNTPMLQEVLDEPGRLDQRAPPVDRRGLTPLFWTNIKPYGEVRLDMTRRLEL